MESKEIAKLLIVVLVVVNLLFFVFLQFLQFTYKAEFLLQPCSLCAKLNPDVQDCLSSKKITYSYSNNLSFIINDSQILEKYK